MKAKCTIIILLCCIGKSHCQSFINGNLEASVLWGSIAPPAWQSVSYTETFCEASSSAGASPDMTSLDFPDPINGVRGNPFAGDLFLSGIHGTYTNPTHTSVWQEGIQQYVTSLTPGCKYEISFYQTVVKQSILLDSSGSWTVFLDGMLIATTPPSFSDEPYNSTSLNWERRTATFVATDIGHYIQFLPSDDDDAIEGINGIRMGIDSISLKIIPSEVIIYENLLGNDTTLCEGEILMLSIDSEGREIEWQDGSDSETLEVTESGTYWVNLLEPCSGSLRDSIVIVFHPLPSIDIGMDTAICHLDIVLDAGNPGMSYLWQDGAANRYYSIPDTGTYSVTVTSSFGCSAFDEIYIFAGDIELELGNDTVLCSGTDLLLNSEYETGAILWSTGETSSAIHVNTADLYWITIEDDFCANSDTIQIELEEPEIDFIYADTIGCIYDFTNFQGIPIRETFVLWEWDFGDGERTFSNPSSHLYQTSGNYTVLLKGTTAMGCIAEKSVLVQITVHQQPTANFTFSPDQPLINELVAFENLSLNELSWHWNFGNGNESTIENPVFIYEEAGNYAVTLTVTNNHCSDTLVKPILVKDELLYYVPNAFTPDGDAFNNTFKPVFTAGYDPYDYHLTIFNRWGEVVFESFDASEIGGWDGTYGGESAQSGVYVWSIEFGDLYSDHRIKEMGHVTLLR